MSDKVYCPRGHIIGAISDDGFLVQHQKRSVTVKRAKKEAIKITIVCDKCGASVELSLVPQKTQ